MTTSMQAFAHWIVAAAALALAAAGPAPAQENAGAKYDKLTGTLKKVHDTRRLTIGYREASLPFSYLNPVRQPIGYSIDLCSRDRTTRSSPSWKKRCTWRSCRSRRRTASPRSSPARSTSNAARPRAIASARSRSRSRRRSSSPAPSCWCGAAVASAHAQDLRGKTVVVTRGTTNEQAMKSLQREAEGRPDARHGRRPRGVVQAVRAGKADTFALDDVLLYGFIERTKTGNEVLRRRRLHLLRPVRRSCSARTIRTSQDVVERTFARLAASRELVVFYDSWFRRKLASGEDLNLTMSPQLEEIFQVLGLPE